jgi:hypothetical protein
MENVEINHKKKLMRMTERRMENGNEKKIMRKRISTKKRTILMYANA